MAPADGAGSVQNLSLLDTLLSMKPSLDHLKVMFSETPCFVFYLSQSVYRICYVCHYPYRLYVLLCSLFSVCIYSVMASSALDQNTLTLDTCSLFLSQILFEDDHVCGRSEAPSKNSFSISIFKAQKGLLCLYIFKAIHDDFMCVAAVFSKHDMDEYVVCLYVYITSKYIYNLYMWSLSLCSRYSYSEPFCIFKIVQKRPHVLSSSEIRRI